MPFENLISLCVCTMCLYEFEHAMLHVCWTEGNFGVDSLYFYVVLTGQTQVVRLAWQVHFPSEPPRLSIVQNMASGKTSILLEKMMLSI